jgi:hypothetical protein
VNVSDAKISRLFVAAAGGQVENISPNAAGYPDHFTLILEVEAGGVIGDSGTPYTLNITAINETRQQVVIALNPAGAPFNETFTRADGWIVSGYDHLKIEAYDIVVPADLHAGDAFYYLATLCTSNLEIVSIKRSNPFVLRPFLGWPQVPAAH